MRSAIRRKRAGALALAVAALALTLSAPAVGGLERGYRPEAALPGAR
jgi:hypothetical protein